MFVLKYSRTLGTALADVTVYVAAKYVFSISELVAVLVVAAELDVVVGVSKLVENA